MWQISDRALPKKRHHAAITAAVEKFTSLAHTLELRIVVHTWAAEISERTVPYPYLPTKENDPSKGSGLVQDEIEADRAARVWIRAVQYNGSSSKPFMMS